MSLNIKKLPTILLVDDDEKNCAEIKQLLELNGCRVIVTDNGRDAAVAALYTRPDLLVMNLNVPLLYEIVAARRIVKNARLDTLPTVLLTEEDDVGNHPPELEIKRNEYVASAGDFDQFEKLLEYLLLTQSTAA